MREDGNSAGVRSPHLTTYVDRATRLLIVPAIFLTLLTMSSASRLEAQAPVLAPGVPTMSAPASTPTAPAAAGQKAAAPTTSTAETQDSATARGRAQEAQQSLSLAEQSQAIPDQPTEFQQLVRETTGQLVPIFGASLFSRVPSTFAPVDDVPVTPDYVIGPGDQLRVQVWGQINQQGTFVVDRTGSISMQDVGTIHVGGLRFSEVTNFLRAQLGRVYRNFDLNVNMGQLRSIQVFVVGQARRPGSYTIGSLSTLLNALFASGGPTPEGSVRDIQVRRGSQVVTHFDLYDLLLRGDKSKDISLQPGDVIFIPTVGPEVALLGSVNTPGIYELRGETRIDQLLELGGGRTSVAAGTTVRVERIYEHIVRTVLDVDLAKTPDTPLQNGDVVSVTAITDRFKDAVTLRGNVANPGRYVWRPGMHVSDLIPNKDALVTRNYWRKRNELGRMELEYAPTIRPENEGSLQVQSRDTGITPSQGTSQGANTAQNANRAAQSATGTTQGGTGTNQGGNGTGQPVNGAVQRGSASQTGAGSVGVALTGNNGVFSAKNDVVLSAPDIDWSYAVIERQSPVDLTTSLLPFNLGKLVLNGDQSQNLELLSGDVVTIFSTADVRVPTTQQTRFVRLEGEFNSSGVYSVQPGETLRHLLVRAGGFTPEAYLYGSEFTRESTRRVERQRLNEYADQLEAQVSAATAPGSAVTDLDTAAGAATEGQARSAISRLRRREPVGRIVLDLRPDSQGVDSVPDLALEDGDRFVVPRVPSNVNVEGQVYSANAFVYRPHRRVIDYLRQAGGPDRQADRRRAFVLRADGSVVSRQYGHGNFEHVQLYPGDTLVVPPTLNKRSVLRTVVDAATIVGQLGFAIAALNLLI